MIKTNLFAAHFHLNTTALISLFHDITNGLLILCHGWISGCKNSLWDDSGLRRIAENLYVSLFVNQTSHMWVHLPPPPRCLTSGLDSLASVSTRAVALTAWASSCSTSLWVLAASRILGRTREGKKKKNHPLERACNYYFFDTITAIIPTSCLGLLMERKSSTPFLPSLPPMLTIKNIGSQTVKIIPLSKTTMDPLYDCFTTSHM